LLLALKNSFNIYNPFLNKSLLLTTFLKDFTSFIRLIVTFNLILKLSVILVSYITLLKKLITNKLLSRYFNSLMLVNANKFISLILLIKLITNKLLDKPLNIDNKNLLSYSYKWKLIAIKFLIKHYVSALLIYN
jgi:hypothetical protein